MQTDTPLYIDYRTRLGGFEGRIPWMYLDSATPANVTVGVGHLLASAQFASALPFEGGDAAAAWDAVKQATGGMLAGKYENLTTCRLSDDAMDALCDADLASTQSRILARFPETADYPEAVQIALLDMGYNMGVAKLGGYPHMFAALAAGDFATAAVQSFRHGIQPSRNDYVAGLISSAA